MAGKIVVAIDGPSASGKSTVGRHVASLLGFIYVDSGSLYRAVTWKAISAGADTSHEPEVAACIEGMDIRFMLKGLSIGLTIGGVDPASELRSETVTAQVSRVAAHPAVRKRVVQWLRSMVQFGNLVMEGRDIGSAVFPDAPFKFYMDASPEERARRRFLETEVLRQGQEVDAVRKSIDDRDAYDRSRPTDPLKVAEGSEVIDTTALTAEQVAEHIAARVRG